MLPESTVYLSTDQVRFYRRHEGDPMPLANVPPLVFSEVLRDVDLFVGVASVGNDPNWTDGGPTATIGNTGRAIPSANCRRPRKRVRRVLERIAVRA